MKQNLAYLLIVLSFFISSCSGDDDSSDSDCGGVAIVEVLATDVIDFTFTIRNGDTQATLISVDLKYVKDGTVIGSGIGASAQNISPNQTVEFTTITTDVDTADDFDCIEYTISNIRATSICTFEGTNCTS